MSYIRATSLKYIPYGMVRLLPGILTYKTLVALHFSTPMVDFGFISQLQMVDFGFTISGCGEGVAKGS